MGLKSTRRCSVLFVTGTASGTVHPQNLRPAFQHFERARTRTTRFQELVEGEFDDMKPQEDALQWSMLWRMANVSHQAGLISTWQEILDALRGKREINWTSTRLHWEKALFVSLLRLQIRDWRSEGRSRFAGHL